MSQRLLDTNGSSALIDGPYRYSLDRWWGPGRRMCFVMLNPSTADADQDDPTIRRCIGFAKRDAFDGITVVNLFAYRCTRPLHLSDVDDPVGPLNDGAVADAVRRSDVVVAAWGAHPMAVGRGKALADWRVPLHCLGTTKDGAPRHPLYVRGSAEVVPWRPW